MRTLAFTLTIGALAAVLSGCLGGGGPDARQSGAALVAVDSEELSEMDTCSVYFEQDAAWEAPQALGGVKGDSSSVVFIDEGLPICHTTARLAREHLPHMDLAGLKLTSGNGEVGSSSYLTADSNPLPAHGDQGRDNPNGDSNPLPAKKPAPDVGNDLANRNGSDTSGNGTTVPGTTTAMDLVNGDSNPLPARGDTNRTVDLGDLND